MPTHTKHIHIALDFGGTKCMAAAITPAREVLRRERVDTPASFDAGLKVLKDLVRAVRGGHGLLSIGCSAGGPLDYVSGRISPLHCPEWRDVPLKEIMEAEFGVPFAVDVDTNAAALAEYKFGGHAADPLLYLTLSTGMGGGLIFGGEIYRGVNGSHPEVGHQAVCYRGPNSGSVECPCGARDCLEALVSGNGIRKVFGKAAEDLTDEEWNMVGYNLGQGLRNLAAIYAPQAIILGGGVALGGGERLLRVAREVVQANLKIVPLPAIKLSSLGYETALWGAFALALGAGA